MPSFTWPWGVGVQTPPNGDGVTTSPLPNAPYNPVTPDSGEFGIVESIKSTVSSATANASRLFSSNSNLAIDQTGTTRAWYDIFGKVSDSASAVNNAFQSTLIKVIVLVSIVGVIAVFGLSYMQAKGANLAK